MLYGSSTAIGLPGLPVFGSIGIRLPLLRVLGVVGDPQRAQVPRRHDVLRVEADLELVDDLERRRVDHVDVVATGRAARRRAAGRRRRAGLILPAVGFAVEVGRIGHRRHAGHRATTGGAAGRRLRGRCAQPCATARAASAGGATQGTRRTVDGHERSWRSNGRGVEHQRRAAAARMAATVCATMASTPSCAELGAGAARIAGDAVGRRVVARRSMVAAHERADRAPASSDVSARPACVPISSSL